LFPFEICFDRKFVQFLQISKFLKNTKKTEKKQQKKTKKNNKKEWNRCWGGPTPRPGVWRPVGADQVGGEELPSIPTASCRRQSVSISL
jgi:hypothetical protein